MPKHALTKSTRCWNPLEVSTKSGVKTLAPCGQCSHCRSRRMWELATKIDLESMYHFENGDDDKVSMWTFTYETQPKTSSGRPTLKPKDLQDFWKRLRRAGFDFRYFAVGEYGSRTGRPHYHAFIFGIPWHDPETVEKVRKLWSHGIIDNGRGYKPRGGLYAAGYVLKKLRGKKLAQELLKDPEWIPEFFRASKNPAIGAPFLDRLASDILMETPATQRAYFESVEKYGCSFRWQQRTYRLDRHLSQYYANKLGRPLLFKKHDDELERIKENWLDDPDWAQLVESQRKLKDKKAHALEQKKTL